MFAASFARWHFLHDPARTRAAYASLAARGAESCDCLACRNFFAVGAEGLPVRLRSLLSELGIDATRPAEMSHYDADITGRHRYHGWYHFIGEGLEGRDGWRQAGESAWTEDFEDFGDDLSIALTTRLSLEPVEFKAAPTLQVEIGLSLPWVLEDNPPE